MKLVHWPLMGGLLHLVQRGGDWAGTLSAVYLLTLLLLLLLSCCIYYYSCNTRPPDGSPTAFASPLSLSAPTVPPFSRPRRSDLDLDLGRPASVTLIDVGASVFIPTACAPPLSLSTPTAPPFSRLRRSEFDIDLDLLLIDTLVDLVVILNYSGHSKNSA